jgi:hypothetical protein
MALEEKSGKRTERRRKESKTYLSIFRPSLTRKSKLIKGSFKKKLNKTRG